MGTKTLVPLDSNRPTSDDCIHQTLDSIIQCLMSACSADDLRLDESRTSVLHNDT